MFLIANYAQTNSQFVVDQFSLVLHETKAHSHLEQSQIDCYHYLQNLLTAFVQPVIANLLAEKCVDFLNEPYAHAQRQLEQYCQLDNVLQWHLNFVDSLATVLRSMTFPIGIKPLVTMRIAQSNQVSHCNVAVQGQLVLRKVEQLFVLLDADQKDPKLAKHQLLTLDLCYFVSLFVQQKYLDSPTKRFV